MQSGSIDVRPPRIRNGSKLRGDPWLSLAAAPTFAIIALLSGRHGGRVMLCTAALDASALWANR
jgi:hypothetical protein